MADPPPAFNKLAQSFVCVRVTDMSQVDLNRYSFDFDLTLAILTTDGRGHTYHRYGGRPEGDAEAYMSMPGLLRMMRRTLAEHAEARLPAGKPTPARTVMDLRQWQKTRKPKGCVHCHTVHTALREEAQAAKTFTRDDLWVWPDPARLGLRLHRVEQDRITEVRPDSAAARAGLEPGDVLVRVGNRRVATIHDLQARLHRQSPRASMLELRFRRGGRERSTQLALGDGWKEVSPEEYAWRPYKWGLKPMPGFGGPSLDAAARKRRGLADHPWAMRVQYIVDWGPNRAQGQDNKRRGLRKGDLVLSFAGKSDFASTEHFHAWVRLRCASGREVPVEVLRGKRRLTLRLRLR